MLSWDFDKYITIMSQKIAYRIIGTTQKYKKIKIFVLDITLKNKESKLY